MSDTLQRVKRKIYFYELDLGTNNDGSPILFDSKNLLGQIKNLSIQDMYYYDSDNKVYCAWVDEIPGIKFIDYPKLTFGITRRSDLPLLEEQGSVSPLNIPSGAGVLEKIHMVFFPNNIVGADFNLYGPRVSSFSNYVGNKIREGKITNFQYQLIFRPLLTKDALDRINNLNDLVSFNIRIYSSYISTLDAINSSLSEGFKALQNLGESEDIEVTLTTKPYSDCLSSRIADTVKQLANYPEIAKRFRVKGHNYLTGKIDEIDVLGSYIIQEVSMIKEDPRSRSISSDSAYEKIIEIYHNLRENIERASSVSIS